MKILYLYSVVMGYTIATIRNLAERGNEVHVVHWDHKQTPYQMPLMSNLFMYKRSELSVDEIKKLAKNIAPAITVISGWMDKGYMKVAKQLKSEGVPVVVGFDNQWQGTTKQRIATLLGSAGYFSQFYSHAWVAGLYQFTYARRLGFENKNIVYDLYSADLRLFNKTYNDSIENKQNHYPHRFLFVGRFEPVKGLDVLLRAWQELDTNKGDWELHLIGSGALRAELEATAGVVIKDFMQPEQLMQEAADAGCFLLPSRAEPWGVVVHEFAAAGLPLIVSDVVGAASTFLISGLNGYSFKVNDHKTLADKMRQLINMTDQDLYTMAVASHALSQRITPETSAGNLLAVVN
ncbi:MAG: glycosyltransferase [Candidatus Electrothrix sp. AR3]|nr:glycosyltransferase [Candidatus Electrothrix sp. AR3]